MIRTALACVAISLVAIGCSSSAKLTTDELRAQIEAYKRGDPGVSEDRITALFARLDAEIATVRAEEAETAPPGKAEVTARREALEEDRRTLQADYLKARVARLGDAATKALKSVGDQIGQGLEEAGRKMRDAAQGKTDDEKDE
jgi:hypothetical protein